MRHVEYCKPATLEEAWKLKKRHPGARFVAGGTDVLVQMRKRVIAPPALISLRSIRSMSGIEATGGLRIGAATTIAEVIRHPTIAADYSLLTEAAKRLGSMQVRNIATIGGNLANCSPCADTAVALLALDARVRLNSPTGTREMPVHEFFLGPGKSCLRSSEILIDILLDKPASAKPRVIFMKKGRVRMDLAIASLAVLLELDGTTCRKARIAAGSVAPVPLRLREVEKRLEGSEITRDTAREAAELAMKIVAPITDIRSTADYRRQIIGVYMRRSIETLMGWD
jgi:carbon-monoxide dehydrogenase medium subunit